MADAMCKAHQRQQSKHKRTGKYVKQRERTLYNKIQNKLLNAARNNEELYRSFIEENGGLKNVLWVAQNDLNMKGFIDSLASRAGN